MVTPEEEKRKESIQTAEQFAEEAGKLNISDEVPLSALRELVRGLTLKTVMTNCHWQGEEGTLLNNLTSWQGLVGKSSRNAKANVTRWLGVIDLIFHTVGEVRYAPVLDSGRLAITRVKSDGRTEYLSPAFESDKDAEERASRFARAAFPPHPTRRQSPL